MIGVVGINHETAPLDVRGQLSFNAGEIQIFFEMLRDRIDDVEAVLVSTCNRTELYYSVNKSCGYGINKDLITWLLDFKRLPQSGSANFYNHNEGDAIRHLLRVAAGLNSMVLGENQILGQLKESYRISTEHKMAGSILSRLFHKAFQAGKRVRSETEINKGASSVSYAAVELSHKVFSSLANHPVLLIGAGEAGDLVLQSLKERGTGKIEIINRTLSRGEALAEKYGAVASGFENLKEALLRNDIIVTSTAADRPILIEETIVAAMKKRKGRMMLLIDLSVPRNIEESIRSLKNIFLFNLDDLQEVVAFNSSRRQKEVKKADLIVDEIAADFELWQSGLKLTPTIDGLKDKLAGLMETELGILEGSVSEGELDCVQKFSSKMHKKYLGLIIKNLKEVSENGRYVEYIDLVNKLFDLDSSRTAKPAGKLKIGEK